jgi:hypothetical protein
MWEICTELAAFNEFEVRIQILLKQQQMLPFVFISAELIDDGEEYFIGFRVEMNKINDLRLINAHDSFLCASNMAPRLVMRSSNCFRSS